MGSAFESWTDPEPSSPLLQVVGYDGASAERQFAVSEPNDIEPADVEAIVQGHPTPKGPQPCDAAASARMAGRWLGEDWAPLSCYLVPYTSALVQRCVATRPLRLMLFGDALRTLFSAMVAALTAVDHLDGALPSTTNQTAASESSFSLEGGRVQLSWTNWTLGQASASSSAMALASALSNPADQVLILGDSRNATDGRLAEYDARLGELASKVRSFTEARHVLRVGNAAGG